MITVGFTHVFLHYKFFSQAILKLSAIVLQKISRQGRSNEHLAGHNLLKVIPNALAITILNHHVKLSRRLIIETIGKINCFPYCAPNYFQTFINL